MEEIVIPCCTQRRRWHSSLQLTEFLSFFVSVYQVYQDSISRTRLACAVNPDKAQGRDGIFLERQQRCCVSQSDVTPAGLAQVRQHSMTRAQTIGTPTMETDVLQADANLDLWPPPGAIAAWARIISASQVTPGWSGDYKHPSLSLPADVGNCLRNHQVRAGC